MSEDHPHQLPQIAAEPQTVSDLRISAELWRLLSGGLPASYSRDAIRQNGAFLGQARAVVKALRKLAEPCGDAAVLRLLEPLVLVYGVSEGARSSSFWKLYNQALRDLPECALRKAVADYAALPDSLFFPKPGQLKALAQEHAEEVYTAAARAKESADAGPLKLAPKAEPEPDRRLQAIERAQELERQIPIRIRRELPMSQWPAEYQAKIAEADALRESAR